MYKTLALVLAAIFVVGGCMNVVSSTVYTTSFETVVTAVTTGNNSVLDINTTIVNETIDNEIVKRGPARFRPYAAWIAGYNSGKIGGGSSAGGKW